MYHNFIMMQKTILKQLKYFIVLYVLFII